MKQQTWKKFHTLVFDFDGVFTNNKVYVGESGTESVRCDRADGLGIELLRKYKCIENWNLDIMIVSKEKNQVVSRRAEKLNIKCFQGVNNKLELIQKLHNKKQAHIEAALAKTIYVGNDINDLECILKCGHSFAPSDAHAVVKKACSTTLEQQGGNGFVRAVAEEIVGLQKMKDEDIIRLISH
jgi:YrbI family 3-deoxy-D-manno-octulosonate 8-phosphate phosphatase